MIDSDSEQDSVSRKEVADIISARLDEIYSFVDKELKSIGRSGLLPAGVIFTGGGASLPGVVELAKSKLRLPARVGMIRPLEGLSEQVGDPAYAVVVGLVLWAMEQEKSTHRRSKLHVPDMRVTVSRVRSWLKSFMP